MRHFTLLLALPVLFAVGCGGSEADSAEDATQLRSPPTLERADYGARARRLPDGRSPMQYREAQRPTPEERAFWYAERMAVHSSFM